MGGCNLITIHSSLPRHFPSKANVMLEYDIDEAQALLEKNLSTASRNLETLEDDLDFLRDQFTTTEVSILPPGPVVPAGLAHSRFKVTGSSFICFYMLFSQVCALMMPPSNSLEGKKLIKIM